MELFAIADYIITVEYEYFSNILSKEECFDKICAYTNFLKLKPELWMFVPVDSKGNIMSPPTVPEEESKDYTAAKNKVLFKDFRVLEIDGQLTVMHSFVTLNKILKENTLESVANGLIELSNAGIEKLESYYH